MSRIPAKPMSRSLVVGVVALILLGGGFTLFAPFTTVGVGMREEAAAYRLSPEEIRARGGGSRGSVWKNLDEAKRRQQAPSAATEDESSRN
jgi:hypothetical protein